MKNDLAVHLSEFLSHYLPDVKGVSSNTVASYSDTFRLFLMYCQNNQSLSPEKMSVSDISAAVILDFLEWLENDRQCSTSTRNQRLAALSSFFRYVQVFVPEYLNEIQRILSIPLKKVPQPEVGFVTVDAIKCILKQPELSTYRGRRDRLILLLLYDTGARVSELTGIRVRDIRLETPARITLNGKGGKPRTVPLIGDTVKCLTSYMDENNYNRANQESEFLFKSQNGQKFTRAGIAYILDKYVKAARLEYDNMPEKITPHTLRHSKAMHLLQADVNIIYIKDILGHADVTTTQIYVRANLKMKTEALEKARINVENGPSIPAWATDTNLMQWLTQLGKQTR